MIWPLLIFALIFAVIFGSYWMLVAQPEDKEDRALRKRMKVSRGIARGPDIVKGKETLSSFGPLNDILDRVTGTVTPVQLMIQRSGLKVTVGAIILASALIAIVAFFIADRFAGSLPALAIGLLAATLPFAYIRRAAGKRLLMFEEQFPEAMDLMARALRAGHALPTALKMTGDEIPDPVGTEFKLMFEQQNYGMSLPDALKSMADRMPLLDARFFVTALLTQREMGGNLSEVLDNLAAVIRERFKVKRQVRVVSAHGRITGVVLGFLPPSVALILFLISPAHMRLLIDEPLGRTMVVAAIILQAVGMLIIRRIVDVEY